MNKKIYKVIMTAMGLTFTLMVVAFYLFITEKSPISYLNIPFPISEDREYTKGDNLQFIIERCVSMPVKYTIVRAFINDDPNAALTSAHLPSNEVEATKAGCSKALGLPIVIPETLPAGSWHVDHTIYVSGRFREHSLSAESVSFIVK